MVSLMLYFILGLFYICDNNVNSDFQIQSDSKLNNQVLGNNFIKHFKQQSEHNGEHKELYKLLKQS